MFDGFELSPVARRRVVGVGLFFVLAVPLAYGGFALGILAAVRLGDGGDVGSAFLAIVTCPIGIVLGLTVSAILARRWT